MPHYAIDVPFCFVVFIETPVFTRLVKEALSDEDYGAFQQVLAVRPDAGDLIRGGGGIRKVRWVLPGRGKSGGIRVIYYWRVRADQIYLLFLFPKVSGLISRRHR